MSVDDRPRIPRSRGEFAQDFQDLMRHRVESILLVASPYDSFVLEEDGHLDARMVGAFMEMGLRHAPGLTRAPNGAEALERVTEERRFDLIIAAPHLGDMSAAELARELRARGLDLPVVLLAFDNRKLSEFLAHHDASLVDRIFMWQGDVRVLPAIVHYVEDQWNAPYDSGVAGVPLLVLVEDSVRYYSSFLSLLYGELIAHSQRLLTESTNLSRKVARMRARPKVLLASSFEEAWAQIVPYRHSLQALIADVQFSMDGRLREDAGATLARRVRELEPDVSVVLQSSKIGNQRLAQELGVPFLHKGSPLLLHELRQLMAEDFGLGDFVFRLPDQTPVARAADLKELEAALCTVPIASVVHHSDRNHFSKWLRARAEFRLAEELRPNRLGDYPCPEGLRQDLIRSTSDYRAAQRMGGAEDFDPATFDGSPGFYRLGGGSLGGKARGLAFVRRLLAETRLDRRFPGIRVQVPDSVVVGTDLFDRFLEENDLRDFAIACQDDRLLRARFMKARLPDEALAGLRAFAEKIRYPLAIRSSSLLEDSQHQPFSGVYDTYLLPNGQPTSAERLKALVRAIQGVYASMFSQHAKAYLSATPYRLEEEKMAVILQRLVGAPHGNRFYPDFSGVARSYNFYPTPPLQSEHGIVAVALGLGRTVVEGGNCLRFCPHYPKHLLQFSAVKDMLQNCQRSFWALLLEDQQPEPSPEVMRETAFDLSAAEQDGTLALIASTYSPENGSVHDGLARPGVRLVSFAPMLKHGFFPLADLTRAILETGAEGMAGPVEIEFAVNLQAGRGEPKEFGFLQIRPLALSQESGELQLGEFAPAELLCQSRSVLGHGETDRLCDLVVVDARRYDRSRSREVAAEVAHFNAELIAQGRPYVLIGVGRWGSKDPWLGIPVTWDQISGARVIVESGFRDFQVTPSQGSHFFQNVTAFQVGYFTINDQADGGSIDWDWLAAQPALSERRFVRHLRLETPVRIKMDGKRREGIITKPSLYRRAPVDHSRA